MLRWFTQRGRKVAQIRPNVVFGRYSDNNKTLPQVSCWTAAEALFKDKKYRQSIEAFFHYLRDEQVKNVETWDSGSNLHFILYQGSKVVRGACDDRRLVAEVAIARMPEPNISVMRRLLEHNFQLYYSRYSLSDDCICMRFDCEIETANPNKLYYGLKELATKADKQDDLLLEDFTILEQIDADHISDIPHDELCTRLHYLRMFIDDTLTKISTLSPDKSSTAISYLLLSLAYRIDYLIVPESKLLQKLEKIIGTHFIIDDSTPQEKNQLMINAYKEMMSKSDAELSKFLFKSTSTFSTVSPQPHKMIAEKLHDTLQKMQWYEEKKNMEMALQIMEYGFSFCQYSYSLPKPLSQLFQLYMEILYPNFFYEAGFTEKLYSKGTFNKKEIELVIDDINKKWVEKYPKFLFKKQELKYANLVKFAESFLREVIGLRFDAAI